MDTLSGHILGSYQVLEQLGSGGMATVYKGYQANVGRYVAIKILPTTLARDTAFLARFQREARTIAQLEHRYILPIYDFGEQNGIHYLVMRYVDNGTLSDLLNRATLRIEHAILIVSQVGEALAYAHQRGVIHRDIKPSNILIGQDGNVLLADFGIAKVVTATFQLTGQGESIGTPGYMSPEQLQGQAIDARSDMYALGIVLYQIVTGRLPFVAENAFAMAWMHIQTPPTPPRQINPNIPEPLEAVILRALEKNPADRFQSAGDMVAALAPLVRTAGDQYSAVLPAEPFASSLAAAAHFSSNRLDTTIKAVNASAANNTPVAKTLIASSSLQAPIVSRLPLVIALIGSIVVAVLAFALFGLNRNATSGGETSTLSHTSAIAAAGSTDQSIAIAAPTALADNTAAVMTAAPSTTHIPAPSIVPIAVEQSTPPLTPAIQPGTTAPSPSATPVVAVTPIVTPRLARPTNSLAAGAPNATKPPLVCTVPLTGGFGRLWHENSHVQERIGCPLETEQGGTGTIAEQPFEHGSMFYYSPLERIYVFIGSSKGSWRLYEQKTLNALPTPTPAEPPVCAGRLVRGFGLVWSSYANVRAGLGCATQPEGGLFEGAYERFKNGTMLYSHEGLGRGKTLYVLYSNGTFERYDDPNQ